MMIITRVSINTPVVALDHGHDGQCSALLDTVMLAARRALQGAATLAHFWTCPTVQFVLAPSHGLQKTIVPVYQLVIQLSIGRSPLKFWKLTKR